MSDRHFEYWPPGRPHHLPALNTSVYENLAITARRLPLATAIHYYGTTITYAALHDTVIALAGALTARFDVKKNDRVMLYLQNSPQYVMSYYAVLRADAVVVPVNPMSKSEELRYVAEDSGAKLIICAEDLLEFTQPLLDAEHVSLHGAIVVRYADYIPATCAFNLPAEVSSTHQVNLGDNALQWTAAIGLNQQPPPHTAQPADWCVIPYSSGTTGKPKGCLHTHRTVNAVIFAYVNWTAMTPGAVALVSLPLFHVVGMQNSMNLCIFVGCTMVIMTRWDRRVATDLIATQRVTHWRSITTMAIDFFCQPDVHRADLSSLVAIGGGGAQVPLAVAESIKRQTGLDYVEGYGLSETISATHINPPQAPKPQCLGIPLFDVESHIVDPDTLEILATGDVGEIVISGPQIFSGYWQRPQDTQAVFFERHGKRFFRTGDLGYIDDQGYYFLVDRLKRMINAAGYKIWPAEIEAMLHGHPDVHEACVIATRDQRRGEQPKAIVIVRDGAVLDEQTLRAWCKHRMANFKVPVAIEFTTSLPKSGAGKVLWRELQAREYDARRNADVDALRH